MQLKFRGNLSCHRGPLNPSHQGHRILFKLAVITPRELAAALSVVHLEFSFLTPKAPVRKIEETSTRELAQEVVEAIPDISPIAGIAEGKKAGKRA
ncbi:hypothetical protein [Methylacidimicrobium sp. AP8]|uniref:hypothetical protein n=1 Tax=Methylacidimicrobium sp. AP8 TaxID=2730359 RepID=UPI0019246C0D|nr:hypothetical protein [Methylacidimicrobium sp. AP8]